jgi:glutamyl-tRNA reductase
MTANPARSRPLDPTEADHRDPEAVRSAIRGRGDAIREEELKRALRRFEAAGECSPEQRAILESMAKEIVEGILATPTAVLESAPRGDPALQTTIDLFDVSK